MAKKRIVVTGMGIVSCFGTDVDYFYDQLLAGRSGIVPIDRFSCENYPTQFAGLVQNFDPENYVDKKQIRRADPFILYGIVAGKKSLEKANLVGSALDQLNKSRCGIILGSGMGGMNVFANGIETLLKTGHHRVSPFFVPYIITNIAGALLAIDTGFTGPNFSISTACATSNFCIKTAADLLQGDLDLIVCGGVEAPISPIGMAGFMAIKALSERNHEPAKASRPWDKNRDGFVIGEGAGVLVLETLDHALKRNAPIYAEYLGGSINCDAYHMTAPKADGSGIEECIQLALKDAGISKKLINYINAHATSTELGDKAEILGIQKVFEDQTQEICINSTKSMTGHLLGGAGGIEAIATIQAINRGEVHPTINLDEPDLFIQNMNIPTQAKQLQITAALSNSFGFGGHNSTLVFAPYKG